MPSHLTDLSSEILRICRETKPSLVMTTGFAPISGTALREIGSLRIPRINYLTDDPWNPAQRAQWFTEALPYYDYVFSPRMSNLNDLRAAGCRCVHYLPFAFAPHVHFRETVEEPDRARLESDVIFAGGADKDRIPYIGALHDAGFRL